MTRVLWTLLFLGLIGMFNSGCPPKPPIITIGPDARQEDASTTLQPDMPQGFHACSPAAKLKREDICDNFFTVDGLACARCSNVKSCVDEVLAMYCTIGACANDPACRYVQDPMLTPNSRQRKPRHGYNRPSI